MVLKRNLLYLDHVGVRKLSSMANFDTFIVFHIKVQFVRSKVG